jgi:hypothetical protein
VLSHRASWGILPPDPRFLASLSALSLEMLTGESSRDRIYNFLVYVKGLARLRSSNISCSHNPSVKQNKSMTPLPPLLHWEQIINCNVASDIRLRVVRMRSIAMIDVFVS